MRQSSWASADEGEFGRSLTRLQIYEFKNSISMFAEYLHEIDGRDVQKEQVVRNTNHIQSNSI